MKHDLDDLIGVAEVGELAGVSSAAATMWRLRHEDFPKPLLTLRCGTIYSRAAVTKWLRNTGRLKAKTRTF